MEEGDVSQPCKPNLVLNSGTSNYCSASGCSNCRRDNPGLSFFSFPKDPERCKRWIINCRRADLDKVPIASVSTRRLCGEHFEDSMFMNAETRNKLVWNAVPTLFNVPNPPPTLTPKRRIIHKTDLPSKARRIEEASTSATPMEVDHQPDENGAQDQEDDQSKLKRKLQKYKTRCTRLSKLLKKGKREEKKTRKKKPKDLSRSKKKLLRLLEKNIEGPFLQIVKSHVIMSGRQKQGYRWGTPDKAIAISLYTSSPKCYRLMRKMVTLPSPTTLKKSLANLNVHPGFNENVMEALKMKLEHLDDTSKECVVLFDEMSIKEGLSYDKGSDKVEGYEDYGLGGRTKYLANHALVVMVRGLLDTWKQPLSYFLTSGPMKATELKIVINDAITKLIKVGLRPKILICDQGPNNRSLITKLLNVTVDKPFFSVENHKIYTMYDPPHLLKNVRNNLKKKSFYVDGHKVSWDHISNFFTKDSSQTGPLRYAPRLTEKHITLPPFAALRVCLATQVFSHSVAVGIAAMVNSGDLPPEAMHTAEFLEMFDKLFNCYNSSTLGSSSQMKNAWSSKTAHKEFLQKCLSWLEKLKYDGKKLPCIEGWKMTIIASLSLWEDMQKVKGIKFLLTGRLNQDSLENLFSQIRGKGRFRQNPDARDFRSAYKQVLVESLMRKSSMTNCKDDIDFFLLRLSNIEKDTIKEPQKPNVSVLAGSVVVESAIPESIRELMSVFEKDDNNLNHKDSDVLSYIAGYIARKVAKKSPSCKAHLFSTAVQTMPPTSFLELKRYDSITDKSKGLVTPSDTLVQIVQTLETEYRQQYLKYLHADKVFQRLRNIMLQAVSSPCESCIDRVVGLFLSIRVNHTLRDNNVNSVSMKRRKNQKILNLQHA